jgi:hypothetical protein
MTRSCISQIPRCAILLFPVILLTCNMLSTTPITRDIALGDLDGDGDPDAFFANGESDSLQPNSVWINQGGVQGGIPGQFAVSSI